MCGIQFSISQASFGHQTGRRATEMNPSLRGLHFDSKLYLIRVPMFYTRSFGRGRATEEIFCEELNPFSLISFWS
jgi:hypothetical protein